MSSATALIKFKKTGNIYLGSYSIISDVMLPYIFTFDECYDKDLDCYCPASYGKKLSNEGSLEFPEDVVDLDEIEIYSDYGGGFYWNGTGSESIKMIKDGIDVYNLFYEEDITDGRPEWANEFWKEVFGQ